MGDREIGEKGKRDMRDRERWTEPESWGEGARGEEDSQIEAESDRVKQDREIWKEYQGMGRGRGI